MDYLDIKNAVELERFFVEYCSESSVEWARTTSSGVIQISIDGLYTISYAKNPDSVTPCSAIDEKIKRTIWDVPVDVMRKHSPFFVKRIEPLLILREMS